MNGAAKTSTPSTGTGTAAASVAAEVLALAVAAGVPVLLWGSPGTGKTSTVRAVAAALGWPCETVIASIREPSDFAGLPIVAEGEVRFAAPNWARRLVGSGRGLLFLDELSTAPPAVQAALLRVVLERVVGDLALPDGVRVVAAANPPEESSTSWDLSAALANRFCHVRWSVSATSVAEGFASRWPLPRVPRLRDGWEAGQPAARAAVAAFLGMRPALVTAPPKDPLAAGRAWPSPRSWEMAARLMAAATAAGAPEEVLAVALQAAVGDGAGLEFLAWLREMDLPDPEYVLADPSRFVLPARGDRAYAALCAVASAVAASPTAERWAAGWRVLGTAGKLAPDVAAMAARILAGCRPPGAPPPPEMREFLPVLRGAGLLDGSLLP